MSIRIESGEITLRSLELYCQDLQIPELRAIGELETGVPGAGERVVEVRREMARHIPGQQAFMLGLPDEID